MLRVRALAALCARELSQSKSLGSGGGQRRRGANILMRTLTDGHDLRSATGAAPVAAAAAPPVVEVPFEKAHVTAGGKEEGGWENEESPAVDGIEDSRQGFIGARGKKPWDVSTLLLQVLLLLLYCCPRSNVLVTWLLLILHTGRMLENMIQQHPAYCQSDRGLCKGRAAIARDAAATPAAAPVLKPSCYTTVQHDLRAQ